MRETLVAVLERRGRFMVAEPLFERGRRLTVEPTGGGRGGRRGDQRPRHGDMVLVGLPGGRGRREAPRVLRVLGSPRVARDVIEALMLESGLRRGFDPAVEHEAREAARGVDPGVSRRDLRELPTLTIDPPSARDFDDAISARELEGGTVRVWVHIADVAAHVAPGSLVDREAHRRATSVYVPGAVEAMLPEELSADACSLVPGRDRAAVTVELDLRGADVRRAAFFRSVVRSDARLDYDQVDRIFANREPARDPWAGTLAAARAAAGALAHARRATGALVVAAPEPDFQFDRSGAVFSVRPTEQTESHQLIEHLMIAANEQVATLLSERSLPALYRVHERPEPERIERLVDALASLGVATPPLPEPMSPQQAGDALGEISRLLDAHVRRSGRGRAGLTSLLLRSLKQAYYSPRNLGHAGLHLSRYCHFTSPIRRYPDLVCHRALLAAIGADEIAPRAEGLEELGGWTSAREREAMVIERSADDVARCFLLERQLAGAGPGGQFEGEVIGLVGAGAFVAFGEGYEGMLPVRRLPGDWWELNEHGTILEGVHTGQTLRLGDAVAVAVDRVDAPRGRVDLVPA